MNQQIEACYKVVGIPASETVELTGKTSKDKRMEMWLSKRLFFATPHVIQNDIKNPLFPTSDIKLIIVDEAHKAKGKYAYCEVIKEVYAVNQKFRVLALSATPGKTEDVIEIIRNLLISKIEVRTENSIDVKPYMFLKNIIIVKVPLGELTQIRDRFADIVNPYLRQLVECNAIKPSNFTKGWIIMQQKKFIQENHPQKSEVMKVFAVAISLLYSLDLLERHGVQNFLASFGIDGDVTKQKYFVAQDQALREFLQELNKKYAGTSPLSLNNQPLPSGEVPLMYYGHPKYDILKKKITEYFNNGGAQAIIFCEFRDTVKMVNKLLLQLRPTVLPRILIGQGGAVSQKDQLLVMEDFRSNKANVLITTSVCEEGIDVGAVDLVICFDINSKNSTRFVQRIGRTGRKRNGKVLILATEGKEEDVIKDVINSKDRLNKSIHNNKEITNNLYRNSPRLVPGNFKPKCIETKFMIAKVETEPIPSPKAKKTVVKKSKKNLTAAATATSAKSIASHFKRVTRSSTDDVANSNNEFEDIPDIQTAHFDHEDVASNMSSVMQCENIKSEFDDQVNVIIKKVAQNEFLSEHLSACRVKDLEMMESLIEMYNMAATANESFHLELECGELLEKSMNKVKIQPENPEATESSESKVKFTFVESQENRFDGIESRYGNQFTFGEPFNTPLKSSPYQPVNRILNSTVKTTPQPQAGPSGFKKRSFKIKTPIKDSPLIRAFEKQRSMSTSTPVANRRSTSTPVASHASSSATLDFRTPLARHSSIHTPTQTPSHASFDPQISSSSTSKSAIKTMNEGKSVMEYFGIASVDDIFEGLDSGSLEGEDVSTSKSQHQSITAAQDNSIAKLLDDDYDIFFNIPVDDEVIESSVVIEEVPEVKKKKIQTAEKFEFNIDQIFGNSNDSTVDLDKNIEDLSSDQSQKTETYDVDDVVEKEDSVVLEQSAMKENVPAAIPISPPCKSSPNRLRPNFSKLMNALKSSNFLTPSPKKLEQSSPSPALNETKAASINCSSPEASVSTPRITSFLVPSPVPSIFSRSPVSRLVTKKSRREIPTQVNRSNVDNNIEVSSGNPFALPIRKKSSMKRKRNAFLCTQAGVDGTDSSDDDDDESLDGFVANDTNDLSNEDVSYVDMEAKYLESLRSPSARQFGNFKMPRLDAPQNMSMIFSQMTQDDENDDWEVGSFIVDNVEDEPMDSEPDELEVAERILRENRKQAKMIKNGIKRRKIVRVEESSDEDGDLEEFRKQLNSNPD